MPKCMCGIKIYMKNKTRNEYICASVGVTSIMRKKRKNRLRWFGHVRRGDNSEGIRIDIKINIECKRGKGRQNKRWIHGLESDIKIYGMIGREVDERWLRSMEQWD